ncbi:MAG: helix-turn-helix domain-containing protein [Ilumatobacteraceae bacterium]
MSATADQQARLIDVAAVADLLGVDIRHIRRLVHERRIPFLKWGHLVRFDPDDIQAWLEECRYFPPGAPR